MNKSLHPCWRTITVYESLSQFPKEIADLVAQYGEHTDAKKIKLVFNELLRHGMEYLRILYEYGGHIHSIKIDVRRYRKKVYEFDMFSFTIDLWGSYDQKLISVQDFLELMNLTSQDSFKILGDGWKNARLSLCSTMSALMARY